MFKFRWLKGCYERGTWKSALAFSTLEIFFWISDGIRAGGVQVDGGDGAKTPTYGRCIGPNFNESQPTNGQGKGWCFWNLLGTFHGLLSRELSKLKWFDVKISYGYQNTFIDFISVDRGQLYVIDPVFL